MKHSLFKSQLIGLIFTGIAGVLLHFLFDWTGGSLPAAPFSAVNESIWEHMKLLFFPMFAFALLESWILGKEYRNFWCVKLIGIVWGVLLIPVLYYTINGALGATPDWVNIAIFFVTATIGYLTEAWLLEQGGISCDAPQIAQLILWGIALLFVVLTFVPPQIPLFRDPIGGGYGFFNW